MPKIINAYAANESIADNLRDMANSIFGDEAKHEVLRGQARKLQREADFVPLYAAAAAANDRPGMAKYSILSDREQYLPSTSLVTAANAAGNDYASPALATAALGAGHSAEGTFPGLQQTIGQRMAAAHEATERAARTQQYIADRQLEAEAAKNRNTPVVAYPGGNPTYVRQAESYGQPAAPLHKDQVIGGVLQRAINGGSSTPSVPGAGATPSRTPATPSGPGNTPGSSPAAPGAPFRSGAGGPFENLPNDIRHAAGLPSFSADQEQNNQRDDLARTTIPELPPRSPNLPQSALDAADAGGVGALVRKFWGHTINYIFGGDITPDLTHELTNLSNLAAATRSLPLPGIRDSVQREKWNSQNIPQPSEWLGVIPEGGEHAQTKTLRLIAQLREQYNSGKALAENAATPPAERAKLMENLHALRDVIAQWEKLPDSRSVMEKRAASQQGTVQPNQGNIPQNPTPRTSNRIPPDAAVEHLRLNPGLRGQFDTKYGPGTSDWVLGTQ